MASRPAVARRGPPHACLRHRLDPTAAVARQLPIPADRMADVFDAALKKQYFTRGGAAAVGGDWVPRTGLVADLRRGSTSPASSC